MAEQGNGTKRYLVGVGVALTMTLMIQTGALLWWAASIITQVQYIERDVERIDTRVYALEDRGGAATVQ